MARASMPRTAEAILIEDEVWEAAFQRRVPRARPRGESPVAVAPRPRARAAPVAAVATRSTPSPRPPQRLPEQYPQRRTVTIKGHGAERHLPWPGDTSRRRPSRSLQERAGFRPDRVAMWAVFLGLLLVLVAAISAHG